MDKQGKHLQLFQTPACAALTAHIAMNAIMVMIEENLHKIAIMLLLNHHIIIIEDPRKKKFMW